LYTGPVQELRTTTESKIFYEMAASKGRGNEELSDDREEQKVLLAALSSF
jgi:hypothetical protein